MERQIHTKTIINIETGTVVYDDAYIDVGPVALAGGKKPKTQMVQAPPPSQDEIEQRQLSNTLSKISLQQQGYAEGTGGYEHYLQYGKGEGRKYESESQYLADNPDVAAVYSDVKMRRRAPTKEEQGQIDFEEKMQKRFMDELDKRPGEISPEQEKALNELYGSEQSKMDEELSRFAVEQAGSRGLSMSDTPYARELLRAKSAGQTELGSARAASKLNFAEKERMFNQGLAQWRGDLQQQRLANLMGSQGQSANTAIGFMNARANLKPTPYTSGGSPSQAGAIAGGVGAAVGGIAMAF